jgi:hypothetical protein
VQKDSQALLIYTWTDFIVHVSCSHGLHYFIFIFELSKDQIGIHAGAVCVLCGHTFFSHHVIGIHHENTVYTCQYLFSNNWLLSKHDLNVNTISYYLLNILHKTKYENIIHEN